MLIAMLDKSHARITMSVSLWLSKKFTSNSTSTAES